MLIYPILPFWVLFFSLSRPIPHAPSRRRVAYMSILCLYFSVSFRPQQKVRLLFAHFSHRTDPDATADRTDECVATHHNEYFLLIFHFVSVNERLKLWAARTWPLPRLSGNNFLSFGRGEWESDAGRTPLTSATTTNHIVKMNNVDGGLVCAAQNYARQRYTLQCAKRPCAVVLIRLVDCYVGRTTLLLTNIECCWTHIRWYIMVHYYYYCSVGGTLYAAAEPQQHLCPSFSWVRGKLSSFGSSGFFFFFITNIGHWRTTDACIWQCVVAHNPVSEQYCTLLSKAISRTWFDSHADQFSVVCVRFFRHALTKYSTFVANGAQCNRSSCIYTILNSMASAGAPAIRLVPSSIDSKIEIYHFSLRFSVVTRPRTSFTRRSDRNPLIYNAANDFSQKQRNEKARIRIEFVDARA